MTNLIALYRGQTLADATLVAVSADPGIVDDLAGRLLHSIHPSRDPVIGAITGGRRAALRAVKRETGR